jgi:DNA repair exonuclease SbcCD ATPase subunit
MTMSFLLKFSGLLLCCIICFASDARAQNDGPVKKADPDPTIKSLLNEVRMLRQTLQSTGLNAYRSQILLERIKISNEQVIRLARTLAEVREQLERTESTIPRMGEQKKLVEALIEAEVDTAKRARMEFEVKDMTRSVERYKNELERLKEREQQQATQLREEQTKLAELEARLQRLEEQIENEVQRLKNESVKQP